MCMENPVSWWADIVVTYCPSRLSELTKENITKYGKRGDVQRCINNRNKSVMSSSVPVEAIPAVLCILGAESVLLRDATPPHSATRRRRRCGSCLFFFHFGDFVSFVVLFDFRGHSAKDPLLRGLPDHVEFLVVVVVIRIVPKFKRKFQNDQQLQLHKCMKYSYY